jgi:hypothetical protein
MSTRRDPGLVLELDIRKCLPVVVTQIVAAPRAALLSGGAPVHKRGTFRELWRTTSFAPFLSKPREFDSAPTNATGTALRQQRPA